MARIALAALVLIAAVLGALALWMSGEPGPSAFGPGRQPAPPVQEDPLAVPEPLRTPVVDEEAEPTPTPTVDPDAHPTDPDARRSWRLERAGQLDALSDGELIRLGTSARKAQTDLINEIARTYREQGRCIVLPFGQEVEEHQIPLPKGEANLYYVGQSEQTPAGDFVESHVYIDVEDHPDLMATSDELGVVLGALKRRGLELPTNRL